MSPRPEDSLKKIQAKNKIRRRIKVELGLFLVLMPVVLLLSVHWNGRHYLALSFGLLFLAMLPFFIVFEERKPNAHELVMTAAMVTLAVASRGLFFMLPQFKPLSAIIIISGIALGAESGFLIGCLSALVSNIFFSQGPWTPWQMFAFGLIGFAAGLFYRWGFLKVNRVSLSVFGFLSIFIIYGGIMNPASILMFSGSLNLKVLLAAYIAGAPMDLIHAVSTVIFLIVLAKPLLEKIQRVKSKYGLD